MSHAKQVQSVHTNAKPTSRFSHLSEKSLKPSHLQPHPGNQLAAMLCGCQGLRLRVACLPRSRGMDNQNASVKMNLGLFCNQLVHLWSHTHPTPRNELLLPAAQLQPQPSSTEARPCPAQAQRRKMRYLYRSPPIGELLWF